MPNDLTPPNPAQFNLSSFADLLPDRDPIVGEEPGTFDGFREGMMQSLLPFTPYESVLAENLISIEWELLQRRHMRDVALRQFICKTIKDAFIRRQKLLFKSEINRLWDAHLAAGGSGEDWQDPIRFNYDAANVEGAELARRAVSTDLSEQELAYAEITDLGLEPVEVMSEAYRSHDRSITVHDQKLPELERRRREVKRDFDMLQRSRPIQVEIIEG